METYFVLKKYVRFYIACENLMINVDQQHNLQRQTLKMTGSVHKAMTLWCRCVNTFDVEKQ